MVAAVFTVIPALAIGLSLFVSSYGAYTIWKNEQALENHLRGDTDIFDDL